MLRIILLVSVILLALLSLLLSILTKAKHRSHNEGGIKHAPPPPDSWEDEDMLLSPDFEKTEPTPPPPEPWKNLDESPPPDSWKREPASPPPDSWKHEAPEKSEELERRIRDLEECWEQESRRRERFDYEKSAPQSRFDAPPPASAPRRKVIPNPFASRRKASRPLSKPRPPAFFHTGELPIHRSPTLKEVQFSAIAPEALQKGKTSAIELRNYAKLICFHFLKIISTIAQKGQKIPKFA